MKINFHGVRGSFPVPGNSTMKYGGNTTCVSISTMDENNKIFRIIIDCGTGAVNLGKEIVNNFFQNKENMNITMLFTHLHPDHTQAFPFFAPNYFNNCSIKLLGMKTLKKNVGVVLEQSMLPPTFPIEYKDLKSKRVHYELKDGQSFCLKSDGDFGNEANSIFKINVMQAYAPSHPQQGAMYYKITELKTNKSVVCVWDIESKLGGDKAVINFARGCDMMIHDTQYTNDEYNSDSMIVQGFGHSTYDMAIDNAEQSGIKNLVCIHYNPTHTDSKLDAIYEYLTTHLHDLNFIMSKESLSLEL